MCEYSFLASGVSVDGIIVVAENVHMEYHSLLMYLWECYVFPFLFIAKFTQIQLMLDMLKLNFPSLKAEGKP